MALGGRACGVSARGGVRRGTVAVRPSTDSDRRPGATVLSRLVVHYSAPWIVASERLWRPFFVSGASRRRDTIGHPKIPRISQEKKQEMKMNWTKAAR